jgi:hypothetical protein
MPKNTLSLAGILGLCLAPSIYGQAILFQENFNQYSLGGVPTTTTNEGPWATAALNIGSWSIVQDGPSFFNQGSGNQFLRVTSARDANLVGNFTEPSAVATMSFDFIGRMLPGDTDRWVNVNLRVGGASAIVMSPRMFDNGTTIRRHIRTDAAAATSWPTPNGQTGPVNPSYGANDVPIRFDTVMNNSAAQINYTGPDGNVHLLAAGYASVWLYHYTTETWQHILPEYTFARQAGAVGGLLNNIHFQLDTNTGHFRSFDVDNIFVYENAHFAAIVPEPSTYVLFLGLAVLGVALIARRRRS